jgi:hypothetical protein
METAVMLVHGMHLLRTVPKLQRSNCILMASTRNALSMVRWLSSHGFVGFSIKIGEVEYFMANVFLLIDAPRWVFSSPTCGPA